MKLYIVFAQRKERYAGEYAPEALAVVTEYELDENPTWVEEHVKEAERNPDYVAVLTFAVDIGANGQDRIRSILLDFPKIQAAVTGVHVS